MYIVEVKSGPGRWDKWQEVGKHATRSSAEIHRDSLKSHVIIKDGIRIVEEVIL